jgi:hypothetical protein
MDMDWRQPRSKREALTERGTCSLQSRLVVKELLVLFLVANMKEPGRPPQRWPKADPWQAAVEGWSDNG